MWVALSDMGVFGLPPWSRKGLRYFEAAYETNAVDAAIA